MKTAEIFIKSLKEQLRDWRTTTVSFLLPVLFMVIFGLAFGSSYYTYKIYILNKDNPGQGNKYSDTLIQYLADQSYEDGTSIFSIKRIATKTGINEKLQKHESVALIVIPENFTNSIESYRKSNPIIAEHKGSTVSQISMGTTSAHITIEGDPSYPSYGIVRMVFDGVLSNFVVSRTGLNPPVISETKYIGTKKEGSEFDYMAPGIMLFAIYMLLIQVSVVLIREMENKTIQRFRLSGTKTWELLAGVSLTQVLFSLFMLPLMFYTAVIIGFRSEGSLFNGMIIGLLTSISAIAIGLVVAAISKNTNQAFLIGNVVIVPFIFLSGVFFPLPQIGLVHIGEHYFSIFELLPSTHAVNALGRIFIYGAGLNDLLYEICCLVIISSVYFAAGVYLFRSNHLK